MRGLIKEIHKADKTAGQPLAWGTIWMPYVLMPLTKSMDQHMHNNNVCHPKEKQKLICN